MRGLHCSTYHYPSVYMSEPILRMLLTQRCSFHISRRFPKSLSYVILDVLEKIYLGGFVLLQIFVVLFPVLTSWYSRGKGLVDCIPSREVVCPESPTSKTMEFLPLMVTSVYCAIGMVWGFIRLIFIYLHEDTTYRGQLSSIQ